MSVSGQLICRLAEEAAEAPDAETALETLTRLRRELDEFERQQVARALTAGRSYEAIARSMGVSRQAVHRRFKGLSGRRRVSGVAPTPEVRLVMDYAGAEAERAGAPALAPVHVLLGILRNGDREAAAALADCGVSFDEARAAAGERPALACADADGGGIRPLLAYAVRTAKRDGRRRIGVEDLLRAALERPDDAVATLLRELGTDCTGVLAALERRPAPGATCADA